ncbi:MAG: methionyl-tRNA formyltransferase [Bacteroidaceae bacterium]
MNKTLRIVYMGTPEFAVETLRRLVEEGYNVVGVVTMPDKAVGRHHDVLQSSPVKQYAVAHGIPVLQPEKLKDEQFLEQLRALRADLQVVVAFRMLPEVVWAMPPMGTFNLHAALLPQYRGAAPINWAVIHGDKGTGITTFFLDHDIDTGRIILQQRIPILDADNAGDVHDKLMTCGAALVMQTIDLIAEGKAKAIPQEQFLTNEPLRHAPKIFRDTCHLQWKELTTLQAHNLVRGLSPYPAAWTDIVYPDGKRNTLKIYRTSLPQQTEPLAEAGTIQTDGKTYLQVALSDGWLQLEDLQIAGKKRMAVADFLRGCRLDGCRAE